MAAYWHYAPQYFNDDGSVVETLRGKNIPINVTNDPNDGPPRGQHNSTLPRFA